MTCPPATPILQSPFDSFYSLFPVSFCRVLFAIAACDVSQFSQTKAKLVEANFLVMWDLSSWPLLPKLWLVNITLLISCFELSYHVLRHSVGWLVMISWQQNDLDVLVSWCTWTWSPLCSWWGCKFISGIWCSLLLCQTSRTPPLVARPCTR